MIKVHERTPAQQRNAENWALPDALREGTKGMRYAGKEYLPQFPKESDKAYQARLDSSFLYPAYDEAVTSLAGRVFKNPIDVKTNIDILQQIVEDADMMGNNVTQFFSSVFETAIDKGMGLVLVEFPDVPEVEQGVVRTRADDLAQETRPYFVEIKPGSLLGWQYEGDRLVQVRYMETIEEKDGAFGSELVEQIRVVYPDRWEKYRKTDVRKEDWVLYEQGLRSVNKITLCVCYTKKVGELQSQPPLESLAYKNLEHWQSSSDQRNILHVARVPILFGSGWTEPDPNSPVKQEVGANTFITQSQPDARLEFVEHSGAAIEAGANDLEKIEQQMKFLAKEPAIARTGQETATGRALDQSQSDSTLQAWAKALQNCANCAFEDAALWVGIESDAEVSVNEDVSISLDANSEMQQITEWNFAGKITDETLLQEAKRRGILHEDVDVLSEISNSSDVL